MLSLSLEISFISQILVGLTLTYSQQINVSDFAVTVRTVLGLDNVHKAVYKSYLPHLRSLIQPKLKFNRYGEI